MTQFSEKNRKKIMKKITTLIVTALFLAQNPVFIYAVENALVESVRVSSESVYITTDKPVKYKAFMTNQPSALVVELNDARLKTLQEIPVNGVFIRKVSTRQFKTSPTGVSRVVLELTKKAVYEITQKGTELMVVMGGEPDAKKASLVNPPAGAAPSVAKLNSGAADSVSGSESVKIIEPSSQDKTPVLSASPTVKPADLTRESVPVILPKKTASAPGEKISRNIMNTLPTELVNLDYSDVDVRDIISMLAAKAGINVIYSDDVTGTTSINLNKVSFDEAFRTILSVNGFAAQQLGDNILRIATPQTFLAEQKKAYLQSKVVFLNYSKAAEVKVQLDAVTAAEEGKGKCTIDETNNALIVTDSALGLENTMRIIKSLDRVPKQVVIEAKLVEVSLDNSLDYGIQWSGYGEKNGNYFGAGDSKGTIGTSALGNPSNVIPGYVAPGIAGAMAPLAASDKANLNSLGGTGVNLPANLVYGAFRLGKVASNYMFDAIITAAAKKGKAKVLSDPKVATLNNKEATINITTQIPYTTSQTTQATPPITTTSVVYLTTGIILKVTPTINSDGRISMKINPQVSQLSLSIPTALGGAPGVDTRSADTNVIVRDGETIVIGGLIHDTQSEAVYKVPLLGDIPIIGYLFRKKSMSRTRMELIIFVTPRIIEG